MLNGRIYNPSGTLLVIATEICGQVFISRNITLVCIVADVPVDNPSDSPGAV